MADLRASLGDALLAAVLFGSRARGTAHHDSDWDLLVIASPLPTRTLARHVSLKRSLSPAVRGQVSVFARTPGELRLRASIPSLFYDIATDAIVLYDPSGVAAAWIAEVRARMRERGLQRDMTDDGPIWRTVANVSAGGVSGE